MRDAITIDDLAALDALGVLTAGERAHFREIAGADAAVLAEAGAYREACVSIAESLEPVEPPAFVKARILEAIQRPVDAVPPLGSHTIRSGEGRWFAQPIPGIEVKPLSVDKERRVATILMKFAPGAMFPAHDHGGAEECYVLSGSVRLGNLSLNEGDFHHAPADSRHGNLVSDNGCVLLLLVDADDYVAA